MRVGSFLVPFRGRQAAEIGAACRCICAASIAAVTIYAAGWIYARKNQLTFSHKSVIGSPPRVGGALPALSLRRASSWQPPSATSDHLAIKIATVIHGRTQMQPFRVAFVATYAAVAAANSLELELPNTALEDVPAGPRELHQRYSEIFRYGNRNAALTPCGNQFD